MGMQGGGQDDGITDINVTPLVDVCLVLVIIFMAVAPFGVQAGIKVLQSQTRVGVGKAVANENVQIRLNRLGGIFVNAKASNLRNLTMDLASALAASRDKIVIVTADKENRVKEVVTVLDISKRAGASKVSIMKEQ